MMSYRKDWAKISNAVKKAAGYRCEWCRKTRSDKSTMVTAHLDQVKSNCSKENLACLCRLCHNHYDSYGISPLLPRPEVMGRILILEAIAKETVDAIHAMSGRSARWLKGNGSLERSWEISSSADHLKLLLNVISRYRALRTLKPVRRPGVLVSSAWKGYMNLFGNQG